MPTLNYATRGKATLSRRNLTLLLFAAIMILSVVWAVSTGIARSAEGQSEAAPSECGLVWRVVPSPDGGTDHNELIEVAVVAENDVWAVGNYFANVGGNQTSLAMIQHWNGTTWTLVSVPHPGISSYLSGIDAISATDIWASGYYSPAANQTNPLAMHWDGSAWTQVSTPTFGTLSLITGIYAVATDAVWGVGSKLVGTDGRATIVFFWDGTTWSTIPSPSPQTLTFLTSVTAISVDDMWAVGYQTSAIGVPNSTFTVHCGRQGCTEKASPNVGAQGTYLLDVAALATDDVYAIGYAQLTASPATRAPVAMRWDGVGWGLLPTPPNPADAPQAILGSLAAFSSSDIWGVGYTYDTATATGNTLTEHWNGSSWTIVTSPNVANQNIFNAVDGLSGDDLWAVGRSAPNNGSLSHTLVERYNEPCVTPTPTAEPTATPPPGSCTITFTDVPADSTFYPFIHCLACQDIVGGYPDGTFRPANNVTRGQLAKIVSNAAAFTEPHSEQTFEDVVPGSTFHEFVERLASRGMIGGYPCGSPEPCVPPNNLPYYRPNANVTRGQSAKIVASAAVLPAPPTGQRTFEDVAEGSTFWQWIEALAATGAVGGYPCGGTGEPCVPPNNLPYYRTALNVTRGQSAKIVSNTFFPDCSVK